MLRLLMPHVEWRLSTSSPPLTDNGAEPGSGRSPIGDVGGSAAMSVVAAEDYASRKRAFVQPLLIEGCPLCLQSGPTYRFSVDGPAVQRKEEATAGRKT